MSIIVLVLAKKDIKVHILVWFYRIFSSIRGRPDVLVICSAPFSPLAQPLPMRNASKYSSRLCNNSFTRALLSGLCLLVVFRFIRLRHTGRLHSQDGDKIRKPQDKVSENPNIENPNIISLYYNSNRFFWLGERPLHPPISITIR